MERGIEPKNIEALINKIGDIYGGREGVHRPAYSYQETKAHELVREYLESCGFRSMMDAAANTLIGDIKNPSIMMGSHLDTVPYGGRYDGTAGIVAGAEALRYLKSIKEHRGICLAIFRAEESSSFGVAMIGSTAFCKGLDDKTLALEDDEGFGTLSESIENCGPMPRKTFGLDPKKTKTPNPLVKKIKAYLELHIEQAEILYSNNRLLGMVNRIAAPERYKFELIGKPAHSGTTRIDERSDAIYAASKIIGLLRSLSWRMRAWPELVIGTVTDIETRDASMNKVCGYVAMKMDIRSAYKKERDYFVGRFINDSKEICKKQGVKLAYSQIDCKEPVEMDQQLITFMMGTPTVGMNRRRIALMDSMAGHDAMIFAQKGIPSAMVFVQSTGGSHNPDEYAKAEHIALGAHVLAETAIKAREFYR